MNRKPMDLTTIAPLQHRMWNFASETFYDAIIAKKKQEETSEAIP